MGWRSRCLPVRMRRCGVRFKLPRGLGTGLQWTYPHARVEGTECCGGYRLVVAMAKYRISFSLRPGSTFFAVAMRGKHRWPARREYATDCTDSYDAGRSSRQPLPASLSFLDILPA